MPYLITYGEVFIKQNSAKKQYLSLLIKNIKHCCPQSIIKKERGKLIIDNTSPNKLSKVFGVDYVSKIIDCNNINDLLKEIEKNFNKSEAYKIEVKRVDKTYPKTSIEFAQFIANKLVEKGFNLSVASYKKLIRIDIEKGFFRLYLNRIKGPGGFPVGNKRAVLLFSGGFDSTLALWFALRKGINPICISVAFSCEEKQEIEKIFKYFQSIWGDYGKLKVYDGRTFLKELSNVDEKERIMLFKAVLYKLASKHGDILITGESINQTHTQIVDNIKYLNNFFNGLVLRPLAFLDKVEIIKKVQDIGLYDLCSKKEETCMLSKKIKLYARVDNEKVEKYFNFLKQFSNCKTEVNKINDIYYDEILNLENKEDLNKIIEEKLNKHKVYLIVCKTGISARAFAEELRKKGYKVFSSSIKEMKKLKGFNNV